MSNESSELTFVRCPQCRNLVPAVSTKCRRCGAGLEASAAAPKAEPVPDSRVVKYPSGSPQSAESVRPERSVAPQSAARPSPITSMASAKAHAPNGNGNGHAAHAEDLDDPLAAFLDQLEEPGLAQPAPVIPPQVHIPEPIVPVAAAPTEQSPTEDFDEDYSFDDFDEELKALFAEEEPTPVAPIAAKPIVAAPVAVPKPAPISVASAAPVSPNDYQDELDPFDTEPAPIAAEPVKPVAPQLTKAPIEPKPRFIAPLRQKAPKVEAPKEVAPAPIQAREQEEAEHEDEQIEETISAKKQTPESFSKEKETSAKTAARSRAGVSESGAEFTEEEKTVPGRLVGWLVSFSSSKGSAYELRTGKFFVSKSSIKKSDFVINHSSVSTPHAMFNVTSVGSVQIQDLMSELGLFIKRRGNQHYRREEDVASLRHGDWIKFGEAEYLVSLLPEAE